VEQILVGLVEVDALLNDGLVVSMQRDAAGVKDARSLHAAGLDFECVVAAIAIGVEPFADGITQISRLQRIDPPVEGHTDVRRAVSDKPIWLGTRLAAKAMRMSASARRSITSAATAS